MLALRWTLGVVAGLFGVGSLALMVVAENFRRSFGASPTGPLVAVLPTLAAALAIASVIAPNARPLLHAAGAAAIALGIGCLVLMRHAPVVATLGIAYAAAWLSFYFKNK